MRRDFRVTKEPKVVIIPMIDIMLFLLVFFMISTLYMVQLNTLTVNLPAAAASQRETKPNLTSITVTDKGDVIYDKDEMPVDNLGQRVADSLSSDPNTIFVLRGDRKASYESIAGVLDTLKMAKAKHVSIATETVRR